MRDYLIVGAGSSLVYFKEEIDLFIKKNDMVTIGVNNVSHMFTLDYSLWTNNKRFNKYYPQIHTGTKLILTIKIISRSCFGEPFPISITDDINKWRTAGLRAIQYAHDCKAKNIYCVGFDGYSLVYKGNQHCYGKGMTDLQDMGSKQKDMKYEVEKDDLIYSQMRRMEKEGVEFSILTPTVYTDYYNGSIL